MLLTRTQSNDITDTVVISTVVISVFIIDIIIGVVIIDIPYISAVGIIVDAAIIIITAF